MCGYSEVFPFFFFFFSPTSPARQTVAGLISSTYLAGEDKSTKIVPATTESTI